MRPQKLINWGLEFWHSYARSQKCAWPFLKSLCMGLHLWTWLGTLCMGLWMKHLGDEFMRYCVNVMWLQKFGYGEDNSPYLGIAEQTTATQYLQSSHSWKQVFHQEPVIPPKWTSVHQRKYPWTKKNMNRDGPNSGVLPPHFLNHCNPTRSKCAWFHKSSWENSFVLGLHLHIQ